MKMLRPIVKYLSDTYLINLSIRCLENEERLFNDSLRGTKMVVRNFKSQIACSIVFSMFYAWRLSL